MFSVSIGGEDLAPPAVGACAVCGETLAGSDWWVTDYPAGEHVRCRDWSRAPFPYGRQLALMRQLYRRHQDPGVRAALRREGAWLARAEGRWPEGARRVVEDAGGRLARLAAALHRAGVPRDALRGLA